MGARLRRTGKAGIVSLFVAIALIGSAWLAYATTAPKSGSYPVTTSRIKGKGFCVDKKNNTRFQFDVSRKRDGSLRGAFHTELGPNNPGASSFQGQQVTSLTVNGNTASFSVNGRLHGPGNNNNKNTYTADVTVTNGNPDTYSVSVHNGTVIYSNSCPVMGGGITFGNG
jgi:hypothetical protein